jgi:hypothetical protein
MWIRLRKFDERKLIIKGRFEFIRRKLRKILKWFRIIEKGKIKLRE